MPAPPRRRRIPTRSRVDARVVASRLATVAALPTVAALGHPAAAAADTARIVTEDGNRTSGPVRASIVVTGVDGTTRALGPFRFPVAPHGLRRSPDGRYFAVSWGDSDRASRGLAIVPTAGGSPFLLRPRTAGGTRYGVSPTSVAWSSDSHDVVLSDVRDGDDAARGDVVRCSVARRRCAVVAGVSGYAATVPGVIVTGTTEHELVDWVANYDPDVWGGPEDGPADTATRRALVRSRRMEIARVTPRRTRVLLRHRAPVLDGADAVDGIVGGPSSALVTVDRYRLRREMRRGETFVRWGGVTRRWVIVGRRGAATDVTPRRMLVPRRHGAIAEDIDTGAMLIRAQRVAPIPRAAITSGGWLATTGTTPSAPSTGGLILTTITSKGRAGFVHVDGRMASAAQLVRTVVARNAFRGTAALEIVGHEAATNAAIVNLSWEEPDPPSAERPPKTIPGSAGIVPTEGADLRLYTTVRVPLDGRTPPTVVSGTKEQAAW